MEKVPTQEIEKRIHGFQSILAQEELDGAFIMQNVDIFYFSGTVQRSILFIPQDGAPLLMVEKSYQRANEESPLKEVVPIGGRHEILEVLRDYHYGELGVLGLEMDVKCGNGLDNFKKSIIVFSNSL